MYDSCVPAWTIDVRALEAPDESVLAASSGRILLSVEIKIGVAQPHRTSSTLQAISICRGCVEVEPSTIG
jgi:hypothetical protein